MTLRHYSDYQMLCVWEDIDQYRLSERVPIAGELYLLCIIYSSDGKGFDIQRAIRAVEDETIFRYIHMIEGMSSGMEDQEGESC